MQGYQDMLARGKRSVARAAVFYGVRDVLSRKKSTLLTIFVLALSFLLILFSRFLIYGFEQTMEQSVINVSGNLAITPKKSDIFFQDVSQKVHTIRKIPGVAAAMATLSSVAKIQIGGEIQRVSWSQSGDLFLNGVPVLDSLSVLPRSVVRGEYFSDENDTGLILGKHVADDIEKHLNRQIRIGEPVMMYYQIGSQQFSANLAIKGIIDAHNYVTSESIFITKSHLERLLGKNDIASIISVKVQDSDRAGEVFQALQQQRYGQVKTWKDFDYLNISDIVVGVGGIGNVIFFISIISAAFIIGIIIYLNVLSKTRQIAILRSIGALRSTIIFIFVSEALLIAVFSIIIGSALNALLYAYLSAHPIDMPFGPVVPIMNARAFAISVLVFIAVSFFSAIYPAYKISKRSIVRSIWQIG